MQIQTTIMDHLLLGWYDALRNEALLLQIVVLKPVRLVIENGDINGLPYGGHPPAHSAAYTHRSTGARGRLGGVNIQTLSSRLYTNPEDRTREAVLSRPVLVRQLMVSSHAVLGQHPDTPGDASRTPSQGGSTSGKAQPFPFNVLRS